MPRKRKASAGSRKTNGAERDASKSKRRSAKKAPKASPPAPTTFHGFLALPPEIRQSILRHVVQADQKIHLKCRPDAGLKNRDCGNHRLRRLRGVDYSKITRSTFAILLTNRQMYLEASELYYSLNTFQSISDWAPLHFGQARSFQGFFAAIGPINTAAINHLSISILDREYTPALPTTGLQDLKSLHVYIVDHGHHIPSSLREFVRGHDEVAYNIEIYEICCSSWSSSLDDFAEEFNFVRRNSDKNDYRTSVFLTRTGGRNGESVIPVPAGSRSDFIM